MDRYSYDMASILKRTARRWRERLSRPLRIRRLSPAIDADISRVFLQKERSVRSRFEYLFRYILTGFLYYSSPCYSRAFYPGAPSQSGAALDSIEAFSRMAPLLAAWLYGGRQPLVSPYDGSPPVDLRHILRQGLIHGTNPHSISFWGPISDYDGRIVEAADIALTIWLLRDTVWPTLTAQQQQDVVQWLRPVGRRNVYDNNWHLFPVLVDQVLQVLGFESIAANHHYARLKSFYQGDGWFSDGSGEVYDYYNAWGIHYALFWIDQVNPAYDSVFIRMALQEFVASYSYFFSPLGYPIAGRSVCYRAAAVAPLVMAAVHDNGAVDPGMARHALDCIWSHFVSHGSLRAGSLTQGYWLDDYRFLDDYSGPASPLWSLRSLIPALYLPPLAPFWQATAVPLWVERVNYEIAIPAIRWTIQGDRATSDVRLIMHDNAGNSWREPEAISLADRIWAAASAGARRPRNDYLKYGLFEYSARNPFCIMKANFASGGSSLA